MPGVIYIQTVPPLFTVKRLREIMVRFGDIGRVYLQAEKRGPHRRKRYTEGWVEFKSKRIAKDVARMLNGQLVGGRRRSAAYDSIWTMKYLHGFKWDHLMEQLAYERRVEQQRLRAEIVQEKRKAEHFSQQVDKGERLKQLEERILKKSGLWERYQQQHQQRQVVQEGRRQRSQRLNEQTGFLQMIFGDNRQTEKEEEEEEKEIEENEEGIGEDKLGRKEEQEEKEEKTGREDEEQMATSLSEDDEESHQGDAVDSDDEVGTEKRKPAAQKTQKSAGKFKSNDERKMRSSRQKKQPMVRRQKKRGIGGANRSNKRKGHKT